MAELGGLLGRSDLGTGRSAHDLHAGLKVRREWGKDEVHLRRKATVHLLLLEVLQHGRLGEREEPPLSLLGVQKVQRVALELVNLGSRQLSASRDCPAG